MRFIGRRHQRCRRPLKYFYNILSSNDTFEIKLLISLPFDYCDRLRTRPSQLFADTLYRNSYCLEDTYICLTDTYSITRLKNIVQCIVI